MVASARDELGRVEFNKRLRRVRGHEFEHLNTRADKGVVIARCRDCGSIVRSSPARFLRTDRFRAKCACQRKKSGPKRGGVSEWQAKLDAKHGPNTYVITSFGRREGTRVRHVECGRTQRYFLGSLLRDAKNGSRCPCTYVKERTSKTHHRRELRTLHNNAFRLIAWGETGRHLNTYRHRVCGGTFERTRTKMLRYGFCPHCDGEKGERKNHVTVEELQDQVNAFNAPGEYHVL